MRGWTRAVIPGVLGLCGASGEALGAGSSSAQESRLGPVAVSPEQTANLVTLGKVWGFLKYHHPLAVAGERDWDAELFRVLPRVLAAEDHAQGNLALVSWCGEVGEPEPCSPCAEAVPEARLQPRIGW